MSTDLLTQLSEYGDFHRETQEPVAPGAGAPTLRPSGTHRRPNYTLRRAGVALAAAALVTLLLAVPALIRGPETAGPAATTLPLETPSTAPVSTVTPSPGPVTGFEGYVMVQELADGTLAGLADGTIWRSTDGGATWSSWYEQDQDLDLMAIAPDGALVAVRNHNSYDEAYGPGSTVNDTPEIHRWDPGTGSWSVLELARPGLPVADLAPASTDPASNDCPLGGLQSWVAGNAIASGDRLIILGDQRVVGEGICDEDFQFLWTSPDGLEWSLVPSIDVDGYLVGITWFQGGYVGVGSPRPSYVGGGGPTAQVWTSADLVTWAETTPEIPSMPADGFVVAGNMAESSFGGTFPVEVTTTGDRLVVTFQVMRDRPGLESIESIDQLEEWLAAAGQPYQDDPSLEELLDSIGVDFPMDDEEAADLASFFGVAEPCGSLTLSTVDGKTWESGYTP